MARKMLSFLLVGLFCAVSAGLAAAEAPVMTFSEETSLKPALDSRGWNLGDSASPRGSLETGAVPEMDSGSSAGSLSLGNLGPTVEIGGVAYHYNIDTP